MQFELLLIALILFLGVIIIKQERLTRTLKLILGAGLIILVVSMILYEVAQSKKNENDRLIVNAFKQGKTLQCNGFEVDSNRFIFVSGTLNFIPNDANKKDRGVVIDISTCKIKS
jgi:hypothetical protein